MNILLWVLQAILAIKLLTTAITHGLGQGRGQMQRAAQSMGPVGRPLLFGIAAVSLLGAIGLILPAAFGVWGWVTALSATLMAAWLLASIVFHIRCRERPLIIADLVLAALAAIVALGRWLLAPL